jgi:hypothetical protein
MLTNYSLEEQGRALKEIGCIGIKAEFEAEGSSLNDISRLRYITSLNSLELHVKIGGVEALRDIYDCIDLGVDAIIAPMVESEFGALKFIKAIESIDNEYQGSLTINIESKNALQNIKKIVKTCTGRIKNLTIGRSDMARSYMNQSIKPDSQQIVDNIDRVINEAKGKGFEINIGGSISVSSINSLRQFPQLMSSINCIETRKVIFRAEDILENPIKLDEAICFETEYILHKKMISDMRLKNELTRIANLQTRI